MRRIMPEGTLVPFNFKDSEIFYSKSEQRFDTFGEKNLIFKESAKNQQSNFDSENMLLCFWEALT